jgi:hypothetical protein
MKKKNGRKIMKTLLKVSGIFVLALFASTFSVRTGSADPQADKDAYQRKIDKQVQDLQEKISETKEDYKEDGMQVNQKIKEYEDRIAEIKREANDKMNDKDWDKNGSAQNRLSDLRKDFYEWRLDRSINSYRNKISDLKSKAIHEADQDKKLSLEEKIKKLEARNNTAEAKLQDLRTTNGENWDNLQKELDNSLRDIDNDYKDASRI